jgi:hypothetical protein
VRPCGNSAGGLTENARKKDRHAEALKIEGRQIEGKQCRSSFDQKLPSGPSGDRGLGNAVLVASGEICSPMYFGDLFFWVLIVSSAGYTGCKVRLRRLQGLQKRLFQRKLQPNVC